MKLLKHLSPSSSSMLQAAMLSKLITTNVSTPFLALYHKSSANCKLLLSGHCVNTSAGINKHTRQTDARTNSYNMCVLASPMDTANSTYHCAGRQWECSLCVWKTQQCWPIACCCCVRNNRILKLHIEHGVTLPLITDKYVWKWQDDNTGTYTQSDSCTTCTQVSQLLYVITYIPFYA